jgi:hypothetical protein
MSILDPPPSFAPAGCCIVSCHALTLPWQLHLLFTSPLPQLAAALPLVAPPPHIRQLALSFTSACCHVLVLSAPATICCVVSHQPTTLQPPPSIASPAHGWLLPLIPAPLSLIAIAWPLLKLRCCRLFCLSCSWASCLAGCFLASLLSGWFFGLPCLLSGWLLHCHSSRYCLSSAGHSASHCCCVSSPHVVSLPPVPPLSGLSSCWYLCCRSYCCHLPSAGASPSCCAIISHASSPASSCIASPHTTLSHLPAPPHLIAPLPLVKPLMGLLSGWLVPSLSSRHRHPSVGA